MNSSQYIIRSLFGNSNLWNSISLSLLYILLFFDHFVFSSGIQGNFCFTTWFCIWRSVDNLRLVLSSRKDELLLLVGRYRWWCVWPNQRLNRLEAGLWSLWELVHFWFTPAPRMYLFGHLNYKPRVFTSASLPWWALNSIYYSPSSWNC